MKKIIGFKFIFLITLFFSIQNYAQVSRNFSEKEKPKYELGIGLINFNFPDYPGSSNKKFRVIPFPSVVYRGKVLRLDDEGQRARLSSSESFETGISISYNFPVDSDENEARKGMPDLDSLFELGPSLSWSFLKSKRQVLKVKLGIRAVFSTNFYSRFDARGFSAEPSVTYWRILNEKPRLIMFTAFKMRAGDQVYNDFFYTVDQSFVTPTRSAYRAKPGLVEFAVISGLTYQVNKKLQIFGGGFYKDLHAAANKESSLVEQKYNSGAVFGFIWNFFESKNKVTD